MESRSSWNAPSTVYWMNITEGSHSQTSPSQSPHRFRLTPTMRQHHVAGDKVFVDFSGKKIGIADPVTGAIRPAEIFVAVLGASYAQVSIMCRRLVSPPEFMTARSGTCT